MNNQLVCRHHGGQAPKAIANGERRLVVKKLEREFDKLEVHPVGDPLEAFVELTSQVVAFKDWLSGRVAELKSLRYDGAAGEQTRAEVLLYERALDRAGKYLTDWLRLNIDERRVQLAERQVDLLDRCIRATFADPQLGLTPERQAVGLRILAGHIRLFEETGSPPQDGAPVLEPPRGARHLGHPPELEP